MFGLKYSNGPLVIQLVSDSYIEEETQPVDGRASLGGFPNNIVAGPPQRAAINNANRKRYRFHGSMKYFNGRFFCNGEFDWFLSWRTGLNEVDYNRNGIPLLVDNNRDADAWIYGLELGYVLGPMKTTWNYIRSTGDDPSTRQDGEDSRHGDTGVNDAYMRHWGYLMYHMYGTGTNFGANGFGFPADFEHLGWRIDYAVAANLNLFAVYSTAWRDQPWGYVIGGNWIDGCSKFTNDDLLDLQVNGAGFNLADGRENAVPESARDIGWEIDLGFEWKLLEHLTWRGSFSYWQPGIWWSYAYPNTAWMHRVFPNTDLRTLGGAAREAAATFGAGRAIDPLFAIETGMRVNF
jgi:hypothetical protein